MRPVLSVPFARIGYVFGGSCCVVPGCGATRGLPAHHLIHWEDGGPTDLDKLKCR